MLLLLLLLLLQLLKMVMMMVRGHRLGLWCLMMMMMVMSVRRADNILVIGESLLVFVLLPRYRTILPLVVLERIPHASATSVVQEQCKASEEG